MRQTVTPGYVPALRGWFWCVSATGYPTKLLFETCRHAAHSAAARAGRDGGEVVVVIPGGEVRRKAFERFDGDNGLRAAGGWGRTFSSRVAAGVPIAERLLNLRSRRCATFFAAVLVLVWLHRAGVIVWACIHSWGVV